MRSKGSSVFVASRRRRRAFAVHFAEVETEDNEPQDSTHGSFGCQTSGLPKLQHNIRTPRDGGSSTVADVMSGTSKYSHAMPSSAP